MIRRILIPLDISPHTTAAIEYGCFVARQTSAEITGMAVLDIPHSKPSGSRSQLTGAFTPDQVDEDLREQVQGYIRSVCDNFKLECEQNGVNYSIDEEHAFVSDQIVSESIYHDLVVTGLRTHYHFETEGDVGELLEELLDHSVTMTVAVPDYFVAPVVRMRVLICFDGSLQSARALQRFSRLAEMAEYDITLLMATEVKRVADYHLTRAEAYLRAHGLGNITVVWTEEDIKDALISNYLPGADMVVLGSHSKKGFFDFRLGSLSRYLIRQENKLLVLGV